MKKLAGICFGLLLLLISTAALAASPVMRVVNCNEYVSLRESPDTKSKRLKKVYLGEFVIECFDAENGFTLCTYDNSTGYVQSKYLEETTYYITDDLKFNQMVINCSDYVTMHIAPDSSSSRVTRVPLGAIVRSCVGDVNNFVYCNYKNYAGYISSSYLKKANYNAGTPDAKVIASGAAYPALPDAMEVINCESWVSLREKARTSATRLARVPLGSSVTGCVQISDDWVYCKYGGMWGYVQIAYLKNTWQPQPTPYVPSFTFAPAVTAAPASVTSAPYYMRAFDSLPPAPSYEAFSATGANVVDYTSPSGLHVVAQLAVEDQERIMAACYDAGFNYLWSVRSDCTLPLVEGRLTWAMIGGTPDDPQLIIFTADKGLFSYSVKRYLEVRWILRRADVPAMNAATCYNVAEDGTLYIMSDSTLYSIAADGTLRWAAAKAHDDIYWQSEIIINDSTVEVCFDSSADPAYYATIVYDFNGNELYTSTRPITDGSGVG